MKKCSKCKQVKREIDFNWRVGKKRLQSYCKECHNIYKHEHYEKNKQFYFAKKKKYVDNNAKRIEELKNKPCMDCHKSFPPYVMDFDHRDNNKVGDISHMIHYGVSYKVLLTEIVKCDLICSNCHRIRTHNRQHGLLVKR